MKNKVLKTAMAIMLIITITAIDLIFIGMNLVTYAIETIDSSTSNKNVKFAAFFKKEEGETTSAKYEVNNDDMKLYLMVGVENQGYFDGIITLENSNFRFKQEKLDENISEIDENTIVLNRIRAGNTIEIEVGIEPIQNEFYDLDMLNKESQLNLLGTYADNEEKTIVIEDSKNVVVNLAVPSNAETTLGGKILTNTQYEVDGVSKRIVQIELNSTVVDNIYPIKATTFEIDLPEGVEKVEVISKGTYATNGESDSKIDSENYVYDSENKKLTVNIDNPSVDGKISWLRNSKDSIVVTAIMNENVEITEDEYYVKVSVEFYGEEENTIEKRAKYNLLDEKDGIIEAYIQNSEKIYKGKIYSHEEREYQTITNIEVNYENLIAESILEEKTIYETETEEKIANIEYKTTTIKKSEIEKVLGEEGKLIIHNGSKEEEITLDTEADENGNIVINYQEGVKELQARIIALGETGILRLNHTKVIKGEKYTKEEIDLLTSIVETVKVKYNSIENVNSKNIKLKDITSGIAITSIPETISAQENKNLPVAITLKTDNEKYELFDNPTFILTMPEGVTVNEIIEGTLSATNDELILSNIEILNSQQIKLQIDGVQKKYITSNINTQINLSINISIEKLMANKTDTIKVQYENKEKIYNLESEPINVVASNSKTVAHLKVENFNGNGGIIEKFSNNILEVEGKLPIENPETIQVPVEYTIINNYDSDIEVLAIMLAKYIDNEGNEQELINYANPEVAVEAGNMQVITQTLNIPAELYFSEKVTIETQTEYSYLGTGYNLRNDILLATESKEGLRETSSIDEKIKVETFAQLGDGTGVTENSEIYNEQILEYVIEVTNTSSETISNLKITNTQENGNIYDLKEVEMINWVESSQPFIEHRYAELDTNIKDFEIGTLNPGESKELNCRVVAKKLDSNNTTTANISVSADGIEEQVVQSLSNIVKDSELKVNSEKALNEEVQMHGNMSFQVLNNVKNLTDIELNDLTFKLYLSEGLTWEEGNEVVALDENEEKLDIIENITYNEEENYLELDISCLNANEEIIVGVILKIKSLDLDELSRDEKLYFQINDIVSNSVDINIQQLETKIEVVQTTNIQENQKVKNGETVIFIGEISNLGSIDKFITIEDELPDGLRFEKIEIIRNGQITEEIAGNNSDNVNIGTTILKGETIIAKIYTNVVTSLMSTEVVKNKIIIAPTNSDIAISNEVIIQIEIDFEIDTDIGTDDTEDEQPDEIPKTDGEEEMPTDQLPDFGEDDGNTEEDPDENLGGDGEDYNKGNKDESDDNPVEDPEDKPNDNPVEDPEDEPGDKPIENPDDNLDNKEETYSISGDIWVDLNENGAKDKNEGIEKVKVKIIDVNNKNTFLKDKNGKEIEVTSNSNGIYTINNVPKGKYNIIFKYDINKYELANNLGIKDYTIESTNEKVAITNNINIEENTIINLELMELKEFDLKIDKYISKVIVQTSNETKTSGYNNQKLVRAEIAKKYLTGATVLVEYTMQISNIGELAGYATEIVDYLPEDMKFYSELNTQWYKGEDGNIYNTSLASNIINPGESKTVKLVLAKTMTKDNTGTTANVAEISQTTNSKNYSDINITDNQSKAEVIVNPATGIMIAYTIAILNGIAIVAIGMYIIKKKVIRKEEYNG